jgi:hypothetical protein
LLLLMVAAAVELHVKKAAELNVAAPTPNAEIILQQGLRQQLELAQPLHMCSR